MLFNDKKGKVFSIFLLVYLLIINLTLAYIVSTQYLAKVDGEEGTLSLGELQSSLLMAYEQANNYYFSIKLTAKTAAKITNKKLGLQGLDPYLDYSEDQKEEQGITIEKKSKNCGTIMNIPLWYKRLATKPGLEISDSQYWLDCIPISEETKKNYLDLFEKNFLKLLYKINLPTLNYNFVMENNLLSAKSDLNIVVPVLSKATSQSSLSELTNNYLQATADVDTIIANKGFIATTNMQESSSRKIEYVVLHYTVTQTAKEATDIFRNPSNKVSAHYIVDKNADVYQMVKEKNVAWHAGCNPNNEGYCNSKYSNMNSKSIGVEIVNLGFDCEKYGKTDCEKATTICYDDLDKSKCVFEEKTWEPYPPKQYEKVISLVTDILYRNNLDENAIIGHEEVNPLRKSDPGPLMDIRKVREEVKKKLVEIKQKQQSTNSQKSSSTQGLDSRNMANLKETDLNCDTSTVPNYDSVIDEGVKLTKTNLENLMPNAIEFIKKISEREKIPLALTLSLITQESKGKNYPKNSAGAFGVMQLTPTAIDDVNKNHDGRNFNCDPYKDVGCQIEYGLRYLSTLSGSEKVYGGLTSYCTSKSHCFKTMADCKADTQGSTCSAVEVSQRTYSDSDAQLRHYNGWGYYNYPDFDYVENVKKYLLYWQKLLCLQESIVPTTIDSASIIGQHQINGDFEIPLDETLVFFDEITDFSKKIIDNCYDSNNPSDCLNGVFATLSNDITFQKDADCILNYRENYPEIYDAKDEDYADKLVINYVDALINIKDCSDNLQDNCTCEIRLPERTKVNLIENSKVIELEHDINWDVDEEYFKIEIPFLNQKNNYSENKEKITFYKKDYQNMILYSPKTNNLGKVLNKPKTCDNLPSNHLICATKNIAGENRTVVFFLQFGYPEIIKQTVN